MTFVKFTRWSVRGRLRGTDGHARSIKRVHRHAGITSVDLAKRVMIPNELRLPRPAAPRRGSISSRSSGSDAARQAAECGRADPTKVGVSWFVGGRSGRVAVASLNLACTLV